MRRTLKYRRTIALDPTRDPFARILARLSGITAPPKARQAYQQFMHESYRLKVAPVVQQRWADLMKTNPHASKHHKVNFTAQVAKEIFDGLPQDERRVITSRAKTAAFEARVAYKHALMQAPAQTPQARQE